MQKQTKSLRLMGTNIHLMVVHPEATLILDRLEEMLYMYNQRFSANDDRSELSQVNQQAGLGPVKVHPELFELIEMGLYHSTQPHSSLNIAIGPLIKLWHVGFKDAKKPLQQEIDQVLSLIDPSLIELNETTQTVYLTRKGMEIDLGALAKGYIADRLADYMKMQGVASGLVNLGGNIITIGPALNRPDYYWRIGVQTPNAKRGESTMTVKLFNESIVTSGIYERVLKIGNETFHHIFDSQTGYPMDTDIASLSIIAHQSVACEVWTTRLFGLSAELAMQQIESIPNIEGIIITKDGRTLISRNVQVVN